MLRKAVDILHVVASGTVVTNRDVADALGLSRSTAHRMMSALLDVGLVQRNAADDGFVLGRLIGELAGGELASQRLRQIARPHLTRMRDRCEESVALHCIQGDRRVLIEQAESLHEHRWVYGNPGIPMPLHAGAASKMLLATLLPDRAAGILKRGRLVSYTLATPNDSKTLLLELERIRALGCAMSFEEVTPGIASIAVPIPSDDDARSAPVAAISLTGPAVRLSAATLEAFFPVLRDGAARIAAELYELPQLRGRTLDSQG